MRADGLPYTSFLCGFSFMPNSGKHLHFFAIFDKIYKNPLGARRRYASKDRKEYA